MELFVIPQGIADGACHLYCIINAMKSLVDPDQEIKIFFRNHDVSQRWEELVSITPSIHLTLNGSGSNLGLSVPIGREVVNSLISNAFRILSSRKLKLRAKKITISTFRRKRNYSNSVVIFRIHENEDPEFSGHWYVAVDRDDENLYLACSCAIYWEEDYQEKKSPRSNRYFNERLGVESIHKDHIKQHQIFVVTLNP